MEIEILVKVLCTMILMVIFSYDSIYGEDKKLVIGLPSIQLISLWFWLPTRLIVVLKKLQLQF